MTDMEIVVYVNQTPVLAKTSRSCDSITELLQEKAECRELHNLDWTKVREEDQSRISEEHLTHSALAYTLIASGVWHKL